MSAFIATLFFSEIDEYYVSWFMKSGSELRILLIDFSPTSAKNWNTTLILVGLLGLKKPWWDIYQVFANGTSDVDFLA